MAARVTIRPNVREQLRAAILDEAELVTALKGQRPEPIPGQPDHYRCRCSLAMRRPLDPETAELRSIEVSLRRDGEDWEIVEIEGLEVEGLEQG